jgi:hypothetical protein
LRIEETEEGIQNVWRSTDLLVLGNTFITSGGCLPRIALARPGLEMDHGRAWLVSVYLFWTLVASAAQPINSLDRRLYELQMSAKHGGWLQR